MILHAIVIRSHDGLPLSASTDFNDEVNRNVKEINRYLKMVSNRAANLPQRCILQLKDCKILLITNKGVTCLVVTSNEYSSVLAFSFLNDVFNEFSAKYTSSSVNFAQRPYNFIAFDDAIHKLRQMYNKPQGSLMSRLNITNFTSELNSRPPYNIKLSEIEPLRNGYHIKNNAQLGVGASPKLEPLPWYSVVAMLPNILLVLLGIYRSLSSFQVSNFEGDDGPSPLISFLFFAESCVRLFQVYLLLNYRRYREAESWFCTSLLFVFVFVLWELRSAGQQIIFVLSTMAIHLCILFRRLKEKRPNYNV